MPIKVNVDASNLIARLNKFEARLNTLPWFQAGIIVRDSVEENFVAGGRPKKWKPRKKQYPHPILMKSKKLMNSIYVIPIKNGVAIGTRVIYQASHQFGYPPMNIPQREYLMVQPEDLKDIKVLMVKHILSGKV